MAKHDKGEDEVLAVTPKRACMMLSIGLTKLYELLNAGELENMKIGGARRISVASINAYLSAGGHAVISPGARPSPRRFRRPKNVLPFFRTDGLLVDPRPIGEWSFRWCPAEDFEYSREKQDITDPERIFADLEDRVRVCRKWVSLGMKMRYEPPIYIQGRFAADAVYMFETEDPAVAARMVEEGGIIWVRSSIFNVGFDHGRIYVDDDSPTAPADGYEQTNVKFRAHLITNNISFKPRGKDLEAILVSYGFQFLTGAHGCFDWYISSNELTREQMKSLRAEIKAAGGDKVEYFDVGPANPHDLCEPAI